MDSLSLPVAIISSLAVLAMLIAMLYLVWISMGDETHGPSIVDDDDRSELDGSEDDADVDAAAGTEGDGPEVADTETA